MSCGSGRKPQVVEEFPETSDLGHLSSQVIKRWQHSTVYVVQTLQLLFQKSAKLLTKFSIFADLVIVIP